MRFATLLTILLCGCGDDSADAPCEEPGATEGCECEQSVDGNRGYRLCLEDGTLSDCVCETDRTVPCSAPGASFACLCDAAKVGVEYCLEGGDYSECDCTTGTPVDAGGAPAPAAAAPGCPSPYLCTLQMGASICTDEAGLPPLCDTGTDCVAAGMPDASCVDPAGLGITLCFQPCQL